MVMNKSKNKGKKRSDTPTPPEICSWLATLIKKHYTLTKDCKILDPCCGGRNLTKDFDCEIINYEIKENKDFLIETEKIDCDLVICNPPFNIGGGLLAPEIFMDKILELVPKDIPIILITPMGFRLNQRKSSKRYKKVRDHYPPIKSIISLPLDAFEDTLFHTEILCFNTNNFDPHYFLDVYI